MPEEDLVGLCQMESFGLACEDAQDKDQQRLKIKGELANPGFLRKWPLNWCVCDSRIYFRTGLHDYK